MHKEIVGLVGLMMEIDDPVRALDSRPGDPVFFNQAIRNSEKFYNYWRSLTPDEQESVRKFLKKFRVPQELK